MKKKNIIVCLILFLLLGAGLAAYSMENKYLSSSPNDSEADDVLEEYITHIETEANMDEFLEILDTSAWTDEFYSDFEDHVNEEDREKLIAYDINEPECNIEETECTIPTYIRWENLVGEITHFKIIEFEDGWKIQLDPV
ncbi:hypothetical protein [Salipaludibacillus aurantiacus]|uniref:DUF4878 domain-containing protein n=1 Tax=Salipaludibacillus aurantiacus TaxID=1601833 RepID=A0A1H9U844_9BACI|nr:hypothetical protein [Salipaludibacillus aurantiacus]SES05431.1 hypothetical protein SAMN05518684_10720 [Salipaludibacillus aurantiacus]